MYIFPMSDVDIVIYPSIEPNGILVCRICLMDKDISCWIADITNIKEYLDLIIRGDYDGAEKMLSFMDDYSLLF